MAMQWTRPGSGLLAAATFVVALLPQSATAQTATEYDEQVRALMSHPAVRQAIDRIESTDDQTMADLRTLTEIPAPPFQEEERARAFLSMLKAVGVDSAWIEACCPRPSRKNRLV